MKTQHLIMPTLLLLILSCSSNKEAVKAVGVEPIQPPTSITFI